MKNIVLIVALITFFAGCGGSSSTRSTIVAVAETNATTPPSAEASVEIVHMITGKTYSVYPGDFLEKTSAEAKVTILHNREADATVVVLVEGSAILSHY